jgi:hypothetical protein
MNVYQPLINACIFLAQAPVCYNLFAQDSVNSHVPLTQTADFLHTLSSFSFELPVVFEQVMILRHVWEERLPTFLLRFGST